MARDTVIMRDIVRYREIAVITRIFILISSSGFMVDRSTTGVHNKKERDRRNDERRGTRTRVFRGTEVVLTSEWKGKARVVRQTHSSNGRETQSFFIFVLSSVSFHPAKQSSSFLSSTCRGFPSPLYLVIPPRPVDLGVAFKAMEKQMSRRS